MFLIIVLVITLNLNVSQLGTLIFTYFQTNVIIYHEEIENIIIS